jgi:hypothetical protein
MARQDRSPAARPSTIRHRLCQPHHQNPTTGANRANIKIAGQPGTYASGKPDSTFGTVLVSAVIQNKTDAMVVGQLAVPAKGQQGTAPDADNFLASTTGTGLIPTVNAAQGASTGKSMSPQQQ